MRRLILGRVVLLIAALGVIVSVATFSAAGNSIAQSRPNVASLPAGDLDVLQIRPDFYMIAGAGGNIVVQVGSDGVVLVDTGLAATADSVVGAVRSITPGQFDTSLTRIRSAAMRMEQDAHRERQGVG